MRHKLFLLALLSVLLVSCDTDGKHFKFEGRFLHLNQGEFYLYSEDGAVSGIDTIKVEGGRFAYEMACDHPATLVLVFPNFSRQPIFAEPGKTVSIKGDASHLKEMEVTGTDDNELMTAFRKQVAEASPPEAMKLAAKFAEDHPSSRVSAYLVKSYLVAAPKPDYQEALRLTRILLEKQERNGDLARMEQALKAITQCGVGATLPVFTARDMKGNTVSSASLSKGLAVITLYASWNYDSMEQLRRLKVLRRQKGGRFQVATFSIDASKTECDNSLRYDSITWPVVCDGKMFEGDVVKKLGLYSLPNNLLLKNGRVIARGLSINDLVQRIEENL